MELHDTTVVPKYSVHPEVWAWLLARIGIKDDGRFHVRIMWESEIRKELDEKVKECPKEFTHAS